MMHLPHGARCWREMMIRVGITLIVAAVLFLFLQADARVWFAPPAVALLVLLKWSLMPEEPER